MKHILNSLSTRIVCICVIISAVVLFSFASPTAFALTTNTANGITYLTGGITLDERQEMADQRKSFSLLLKFAARSGKYLGDSSVTVNNAKNAVVFQGTTDGPWLFMNLPTGNYKVTVKNGDVSQTQKISIGKNTHRDVTMYWNVIDNE
jgi:hypothetical protein